ncbi:MAG: DNA-processing protein DprA [Thermodesulfobacteriota bacterium]
MPDSLKRYLPWIALRKTPGIGDHLFKVLMDIFGTPEMVFAAPEKELADIKGIHSKVIAGIKENKPFFRHAEQIIARLENTDFSIVSYSDPHYPSLLRQIHDPPAYMMYKGSLKPSEPAVSMVGSRNATSYGIRAGEHLACELGKKSLTVVSGMARGIDTSAHQGAVRSGGRTIAVLGSGLNRIYPAENRKLYYDIARNGAVVSEFGINDKPDAVNFPRRNRIIAGMSSGTCVVEAARKSGSLITARLAAEYGREVFAVPGSIFSQKSRGCHSLIKQGAKPVEKSDDIIEEIAQFKDFTDGENVPENLEKKPAAIKRDADAEKILEILDPYPVHIDTIAEVSGIDTGTLLATLLKLEIDGLVKQSQGKYFSKIKEQN